MKRRIKIVVAYDGTGFNGWQVQSGGRTVQGELERAISKVLKEEIKIVGSGRTDTGVHAFAQVAHFDTNSHLECEIMKRAFNANLPKSIVVRKVEEVDSSFHARFSAVKRQYRYFITDINLPFFARYAWILEKELDLEKMEKAAALFVGEHDFKFFGSPMVPGGNTVRKVFRVRLKKRYHRLEIVVEANAFLRKMVRNIVGALVSVGEGRCGIDDIKAAVEAVKPLKILKPAPAEGLFLWRVFY